MLALLVPACGGDEPAATNGAGRPAAPLSRAGVSPRTPLRQALPEPPAPPSAGEKLDFLLGLLESGDMERLAWARAQILTAGTAAAPALAKRLGPALYRNPFYAEHLLDVLGSGKCGQGPIDLLRAAAAHEDGRVRQAAARALAFADPEESVPVLLDLLADPIDSVGRIAVESLEKIGGETAARGLLGRYPDRIHALVRSRAITALGRLLPRDEAGKFLTAVLEDEDLGTAITAARVLLGSDEAPLREDLRAAVRSRFRPELERDIHPQVAFAIREVLAGTRDPELVPDLVAGTASPERAQAVAAIRLLGRYPAEDVGEALWKVVARTRGELRREALYALHTSGDPDALDRVAGLLRSPAPEDRLDGALLCGLIRAPELDTPIVEALADEGDLTTRLRLANALSLIGDPRTSIYVARTLAKETETDVSQASLAFNCALSLRRFEAISDEALAVLVRACSSPNPAIRLNAGGVLGYHGHGQASKDALEGLLVDPSADVRRVAVRAWLEFDGARPGPAAEAYVTEPREDIAKDLARCVEQLRHRWAP